MHEFIETQKEWMRGDLPRFRSGDMATPHVAGVAALDKAARGESSQSTIDSWLKTNATLDKITGNPTGTPNRLLFKSTL